MRLSHLALAALLPATVLAAPASPTAAAAPGFIRGAALPKWALPLAEIPATQRDDAVVIRLNEHQAWTGSRPAILYNRAIQVNQANALGAIGQFAISYYSQYQKLYLHHVLILRGAQRLDRTAEVGIRALQREREMEAGMVGGATTLQLLLDDVRVGDTLWISYTIEGDNPVFDQRWAKDFSWDSGTPQELRRLTILHPATQSVQWRQLGDFRTERIAPRLDARGDVDSMRFESRGIEAVEGEPSVPADYLPARLLQFSTYRDWGDVAAWAGTLFPPLPAAPALGALAAELAKQPGQRARAQAALRWVQDEIRYFSVAIGENSHRPQPPQVVLKRRYGDCKDKSYLLVSLLRELGIEARPVLLSADTPRALAKALPSPTWFNHVIVRLTVDGQEYFVDPTRSHQPEPLAVMPGAFPGAAALVVDPATKALTTLPEQADAGPAYEHIENFVVADLNGAATLETHNVYRGTYADAMRAHFTSLSASEQRKSELADYEKRYPGIAMVGVPRYQDDSADNRVEIVSRYNVPQAVSLKEHRYAIALDSRVIEGTLRIPSKLVRNFPFAPAAGAFHGRYRMHVRWPEQVRGTDAPSAKTVDNPYFRVQEEYALRGNLLDYVMDYRVKQRAIPAAELPALQEHAKALDSFTESTLGFGDDYVLPAALQAYSLRDLDSLQKTLALQERMPALRAKPDAAIGLKEACEFVYDARNLTEFAGPDAARLAARLAPRLKAGKPPADARPCLARLAWAGGEFQAVSQTLAADATIADDDPLVRALAWAQFYNGDTAAALATMARYQDARSRPNAGTPNPADAASQIALLQRAGQPVPTALAHYARAMPDGPWPRPVLAMQVGAITEQALLQQAEALPADASALALNEAWFYVGQARLARHDKAGASAAFNWFNAGGLRGAELTDQAKAELDRLRGDDAHLEAARRAMRDKNAALAIAELRLSAAGGAADGQYALGLNYLHGNGVGKDAGQALHWLHLAAEQGQAQAQALLGALYFDGQEVPKDDAAGLAWLRKAAAQGERGAQYNLGLRYRDGDGVPVDAAQALALLRSAADQGEPDAMVELAIMYRDGAGVAVDFQRAEFWNRRAIAYGSTAAMNNLGIAYEHGESVPRAYDKAVAWYRAAAEQGEQGAQINLGIMYLTGRGVAQDYAQAANWYRKAADAGNALAQLNLADLYDKGNGVRRDQAKAMALYRQSAAQGNTDAMVSVGEHYFKGDGLALDYAEARRWYVKAAEQHNAAAEFNLAILYEQGRGVPADAGQSRRWCRLAAEHGDRDAQAKVGDWYFFGDGEQADAQQAAAWYAKAAAQNQPWAQGRLGHLYLVGNGLAKDLKRAVDLLRQAAEQHDARAASDLASCYERGLGLDKDEQQAARWYEVAAKQGNPFSQVRLALLLRRRNDEAKAAYWAGLADQQKTAFQLLAVGDAYRSGGEDAAAQRAYLRALAAAEQQPGDGGAALRTSLNALADFYAGQRQYKQAEPYQQRLLSLVEQVFGADSGEVAVRLDGLSAIYWNQAQYARVEPLLERARAIRARAFGADSRQVAEGLALSAAIYQDGEQVGKAVDVLERALAIVRALPGDQQELNARLLAKRASLHMDMGEYAQAEALFLQALSAQERLLPPQAAQIGDTTHSLAKLYFQTGRYALAEASFQRSLAIVESNDGKNDLRHDSLLNNMAHSYVRQGKLVEAEQRLLHVLALRRQAFGDDRLELAYSHQYLGELYIRQRRFDDAEAALGKALRLRERYRGPEHSQVAESLQAQGELYSAQGRYDLAEAPLLRALAIRRKAQGEAHPDTVACRAALAAVYRHTSRAQAAAELERPASRR